MSRQYWANVVLCVFLGILAIFAVTKMGSALTPKGLLVGEPEPSAQSAPFMPKVRLTRYIMAEKEKNVIQAGFTVRNDSPQDVKNINVLCEFFDSGGVYMDRKRWYLPETVPAGQEKMIPSVSELFVNSNARVLNCRIADFQLVKEPFFTLHRSAAAGHESPAGSGGGHGHDSASGGGHH